MKKIYLLSLCAILSGAISAQSLYFNDDTGADVTGTTIYVADVPSTSTVSVYLEVGNSSANNLNVKVTRYEMTCVPGTENYFCWAQCYGNVPSCDSQYSQFPDSSDPQWADFLPINAGSSWPADGNFFGAYHIPLGNVGTALYRYVAFDGNDPNDSVYVDVQFDIAVGVEEVKETAKITPIFPNPTSDQASINYEFVSEADATLEVYNMVGELIERVTMPGRQGTAIVSTDELDAGIYFYSVTVEGESIHSEKLIVTK